MSAFEPRFTITNAITAGLTTIERARGFLQAATLSEEWVRRMSQRALLLEAHHTTHIEGTQLTLEQSERVWAGEHVAGTRPDDVRELLNYREAFSLVSTYLESGEPITEGLIRKIHGRLVKGVAKAHHLSARQSAVLAELFSAGRLTVADLEAAFPGANRRTLQRDLKALVEKGLALEAGTGPTDPTRHYLPGKL